MHYASLPPFDAEGWLHVVVESPRGSTVKLKYSERLQAMTLVRPLPAGLAFPCDWGFIPSTLAPDGDPLDAVVIWDHSTFPGVVVPCRLLGVLAVEQNSRRRPGTRERNDRVIAVPKDSGQPSDVRTVDDLPERLKRELETFFVASTVFENKALAFLGWKGIDEAEVVVRAAMSAAGRG